MNLLVASVAHCFDGVSIATDDDDVVLMLECHARYIAPILKLNASEEKGSLCVNGCGRNASRRLPKRHDSNSVRRVTLNGCDSVRR